LDTSDFSGLFKLWMQIRAHASKLSLETVYSVETMLAKLTHAVRCSDPHLGSRLRERIELKLLKYNADKYHDPLMRYDEVIRELATDDTLDAANYDVQRPSGKRASPSHRNVATVNCFEEEEPEWDDFTIHQMAMMMDATRLTNSPAPAKATTPTTLPPQQDPVQEIFDKFFSYEPPQQHTIRQAVLAHECEACGMKGHLRDSCSSITANGTISTMQFARYPADKRSWKLRLLREKGLLRNHPMTDEILSRLNDRLETMHQGIPESERIQPRRPDRRFQRPQYPPGPPQMGRPPDNSSGGSQRNINFSGGGGSYRRPDDARAPVNNPPKSGN